MSQDVLRQIQGLQGCREPHSSRWRFGLETLEEETIFENGWMHVHKLDFLFDLGKRSLIFVEKSRPGLPSKGEVWSGDPWFVMASSFCTCQMWKLNLSWKMEPHHFQGRLVWRAEIGKLVENWGFFPRFSPYRYHRHTNLRVAKFGTCQQTSWLRSFPRDPGAPQVIES